MAKQSKKPQLVHEAYGATAETSTITRTWADTNGTYLAGRSHLDEVDAMAIQMERKWGCGRLRLLVPVELRERFDRQRLKTTQAQWHGNLEDVRREAPRMVAAWRALDRVAIEAGSQPIDRRVLEFTRGDGTVVAIVPDNATASLVVTEGRKMEVYSLDEIDKLLAVHKGVMAVKQAWPGATVVRVKSEVDDPLEAIGDSREPLDDLIPF